MKAQIITAIAAMAMLPAQAQYAPAGDRIKTQWAETVTPENVWQEYPRPLMKRARWQNLNGLWDYAIVPAGSATPEKYDGRILVPFCVESSLSGVNRTVSQDNELWYNRNFTVPADWADQDLLLNFGAVDWKCDVWVNGNHVGGHTGGYTPFSLDITDAVNWDSINTLTIRVLDPTDKGYQARGKQHERPHGIWYTPVTGIWQTVWMEPVNRVHIAGFNTVADIDRHTLELTIDPSTDDGNLSALIEVADNGITVNRYFTAPLDGQPITIEMATDAKLWSPDSPTLYDLTVTLLKNDEQVDRIESYAAMRKISTARDADGIVRMQLNNKDLFQFGPLDQGWWPDGLYTAPSYEAMISDIDRTKDLGFNMIRKHVKVEPALWYAYCDKAGILVWQDMPNGDKSPRWQNHNYFNGEGRKRSQESEAAYRAEWQEIIDALRQHPSIVVWVPFNEAWGQFKTPEIARWTKSYDPSRLVNPASGGNFYPGVGDILDLHNYPGPAMYLHDTDKVNALGEYGGIGYAVEGHLWEPDRNWGYVQFKTSKDATDCYVKYAEELLDFIPKGFSAAVYTQTTDVEIEINGILTYDRKVTKLDADRVRRINRRIATSLDR